MNSIKNAIVTMTLLAVGYGAYVVLNNPAPQDALDQVAEGDQWQPPELSHPDGSAPSGSEKTAGDVQPAAQPLKAPAVRATADAPTAESRAGVTTQSNTADSSSGPTATKANAADGDANGSDLEPLTEDLAGESDRLVPPTELQTLSQQVSTHNNSGNFYATASNSDATATSTPSNEPHPDHGGTKPNGGGRDDLADAAYPTTDSPELPFHSPDDESAGQDELMSGNGRMGSASENASGFEATWQSVQDDLAEQELASALVTLSAWYDSPELTDSQRQQTHTLLDQLAGTVIYSPESFLDKPHIVQTGETLQSLAQQYQVTPEFLARVNGIGLPAKIFPGETLKVVQGPFRAELNRETSQLALFLGRYYAGRFETRIGEDLPPGEHSFEVAAVQEGRGYFDRQNGQRFAADDPNNPYGGLWIGLRGDQVTAAHQIAIHEDMGQGSSGCIAVSPADAYDLSIILSVGSRVLVSP